jgi:threonine synthase
MALRMISTRDGAQEGYSYTDVLLAGLAPDGGLYVPNEYPVFSLEELQDLQGKPYSEIAYAVKKKLVDGAIGDADLLRMSREAYSPKAFGMEKDRIVPTTEIGNGLWIENLSLGPTASFKDMAMQFLGLEMEHELKRRGQRLVILGATSGDTGSAAEAAMRGKESITLFMLSPETGMSEFQKAQMGALSGGNIFNISIRGRFDDCQDLVKAVKQDASFSALGAVNSINWARISSQIPYYFAGYLQVARSIGEPVDFAVPSGNFGNALSGYIAKKMGLPIRAIIVATNENHVLDTLFRTGIYQQAPAQVTSSPSMDISKASNYERLAFDILSRDPERTKKYMEEFAQKGTVALSDYGVDASELASLGFKSGSSTHEDRIETIRRVYKESSIVIDPHTADGVSVAHNCKSDAIPMICMATALPVKFENTIQEALGFTPERPARFANMEAGASADSFRSMDMDIEELKSFIRMKTEK